jgi:hypothetical protein
MVELATILVGVVVPLIIGPLSVFCKSLWDRYSKSKELKVKNRYEKKMSELSDKINLFYWPVYLKLKTLDRINYHIASQTNNNPESDSKYTGVPSIPSHNITLEMGKIGETTLSEYSSDGGELLDKRRIQRVKRKKRNKDKNKRCTNPNCNRINRNPQLSGICQYCRNQPPILPIENESKESHIQIQMDTINISPIQTDNEKEMSLGESDLEWQPEPFGKRNGYSVRHIELHNDSGMLDNNLLVSVDRLFLSKLDIKILKLCMEIKEMTEKNISIIQPSRKLVREIIKFTRYTEMLEIIQETSKENNKKYEIEKMGVVNNTYKLTQIIKSDLDKYMSEYSQTFEDYNETSFDSCCAKK